MLKLHDPGDERADEPKAEPPPAKKKAPPKPFGDPALRCRRCGKKARWPLGSPQPLFCTRLCGYLFAVGLLTGRK